VFNGRFHFILPLYFDGLLIIFDFASTTPPILSIMLLVTALTALVAGTALAVTKSGKKSTKNITAVSSSPTKRNLTEIKVSSTKQMRKVAYHLYIMKLAADIELVWCEREPGTDGYLHPVFKAIEDDGMYRDDGVIMVSKRRVSLQENRALINSTNSYPRKVIVRVVDESDADSRKALLFKFQAFMANPDHNRYGYEYTVDDSSDLTPNNEDALESVDNYLQDHVILNIITAVYNDTGRLWYGQNTETAIQFFAPPVFPLEAIEMLGYPTNDGHGGNGPDFNEGEESIPPALGGNGPELNDGEESKPPAI
jgi:hypothetical protein